MQDSAKRCVSVLLDVLAAHGVTEMVCSPGSRNTPLLIAADAREELHKCVVIDERAAAFIALGKAQVGGRPVALVCTSGTAMLNYGPALAEAYHQGVPLIAVSADRPMEWIDQDDSQTIRQQDAFSNYIKGSYDIISGREDDDFLWYVERIANEGMLRATGGKPGPVHFNVRLGDPLGTMTPREEPKVRYIGKETGTLLAPKTLARLAAETIGKKVLIVAGYLPPDDRLNKAVTMLRKHPNVAVMAETISNLHLPSEDYMVDSLLCHLDTGMKEECRPDILITIGGAVVSRMLKEWIREHRPEQHWLLSASDTLSDCYKSLTLKIDAPTADFLRQLEGAIRKQEKSAREGTLPPYGELFGSLRKKAAEENRMVIEECGWCDLTAYNLILRSVPESANLFLSNGTSIRYTQILSEKIPHATFCNRGVSGIDGSTSTAMGGMSIYGKMTVLLTGDMSMSYDIGALGTGLADGRMRIIVVNNGGGEIFRFIRTTSTLPMREKYFCAPPLLPLEKLADAYGWNYAAAHNKQELRQELKRFYTPGDKPRLLEVFTDPEINAQNLRKILKIK